MLSEYKMIKSCIAHCRSSADDIRSLAENAQDYKARDELNKALGSISDCINKCEGALSKAYF